MKKILVGTVILIAIGILGALWINKNFEPASSNNSSQDFLITKGSSAGTVGDKLEKAGLIKSALVYKIYVRLTGVAGKIQAGEYKLSPSYSLFRIVEKLLRGPDELWVTIPEGYRREEIAQKFAEGLSVSDPLKFKADFLTASKGKEGYLFPETYLFAKDASASAVVKKMLSVFDTKITDKMKSDIAASERTLEEVVIMASIVERETKTDLERPTVAGILYNRLKIGMPLQVDATVQYVIANSKCQITNSKCEWWPTTTIDDRNMKSVYNTYKYAGLTPGPIASPGISSIKAATYPAESSYLYYLHGRDGQIHYAKTLEEHNINIQKYIK